MSNFEDYIIELEEADGLSTGAVQAASDCIAFTVALHSLFVETGVLNGEAPIDVNILENLVDAFLGELGAAALFLAQPSYAQIVTELNNAYGDVNNTEESEVIPKPILLGFKRFAKRVEKTIEMLESMRKLQEEG